MRLLKPNSHVQRTDMLEVSVQRRGKSPMMSTEIYVVVVRATGVFSDRLNI
jgi:hypothetical protein